MPTKAQRLMVLAEGLVTEVAQGGHPDSAVKIYGGLCHSFPVLMRTCGLCQALAFSADKSTAGGGQPGPRPTAHALLLRHVARVLGQADGNPLAAVRTASTTEYMLQTRQVLEAW